MKKISCAVLGVFALGTAIWAVAADGQSPEPFARGLTEQSAGKPAFGQWGVDLSGMDRSVKPGDDFFRFVEGAWFDKAAIPADRTSTGSFDDLNLQSESRVGAILADLESRKTGLSPEEKRVRDLYRSFLDTDRVEKLGLTPAEKDLQTIAALKTHADVARAMGSVTLGTGGPFRAGIGIDDKKPSAYAVFINQSGLGLPDRDYYLLDEKAIAAARAAYVPYIARILNLADVPDSEAKAAAIFKLESDIAKLQWARADRRDPIKVYNPMSVAELEKFAPQFAWAPYLGARGIPGGETRRVIIGENTAFPKLAALFADTDVAVWRDYMLFHYLSGHAAELPKRFDEARFDFYGKVLGGQSEQLAREKRGVQYLDGLLGEDVGRIYVARYFTPAAKAKAKELVGNLLDVYRSRIQTADWMGPATRAKALDKLNHLMVKIGYPDTWRDYSKYQVKEDDLLGNSERGEAFEWNRELRRLDGPVDRAEWDMSPQTVNAYYDTSLNEIVFPAAILQPPFFDASADDAVNYGGIGAVIGHEMSHGFDDQGSKYDATGELKEWWTADDRKNFEGRTSALVEQFNGYSPVEGMSVNGRLTLGENIADLAGLTVAEAAYRLSLKGAEPPVLDGFTGDQRLFLSFAQVWRFKASEQSTRERLLSDPHSPPRFRVDGTLRNVDAWYTAWGVMPGDKLYLAPDQRVHLW